MTKFVKILKWQDAKPEYAVADYERVAAKHGCRLPDPNESLEILPCEQDEDYLPCAVKHPSVGLLLRDYGGLYYDGGHYVDAFGLLGDRGGVIGVRIEQPEQTRDDILDSLIEIVEENLTSEYSCRDCAMSGNAHYVSKESMPKVKAQMRAVLESAKEKDKKAGAEAPE